MKIFYLSTTSFSDCELKLLNSIGKTNEIKYAVIIPKKNNNYTEEELRQNLDEKAVSLVPVALQYRFRDPRQIFAYLKLLLEIRRFKPDVVYINFFHDIYFNLLSIPFLKRKKTIFGIHDVLHHSGTKNASLLTVVEKLLLKKFRHTLTFSQSQAELLKKKYPGHQVTTIPLMLKDFGAKPAGSLPYTNINFLFFGNIQSYKGLDILLAAVSRLQTRYKGFSLTIAGRCKDWETTYQPLIKSPENIRTEIRFVENTEIPVFFSEAHYLVLPYKDVTQSGPLMIAYNYNLPVICSRIEGFTEFVDEGKTGYLFDYNDVSALEQVMIEAIERKEAGYRQLVDNVEQYKQQYFADNKIREAYLTMFRDMSPEPQRQNVTINTKLSNSIA